MKEVEYHSPPRLALAFFRWYCHPHLREEIEGDLLEQFHHNIETAGLYTARRQFVKETLLLFRPTIIGNAHHLFQKFLPDMKTTQWMKLILLNLLIVSCMFLPFIPGRYDRLVLGLSMSAQVIGYLGLLLVPVGALWLIQEFKKMTESTPLNNWNNGYYFAITATVVGIFFSLILVLSLFMTAGPVSALIALMGIFLILIRLMPQIRDLKRSSRSTFNAAPLYLLSIPLIAFAMRAFFIGPASDFSRNYAIDRGQRVVQAIEEYNRQKGSYPTSLEYVYDIPRPSVMGISEFKYELHGETYNLYFEQWQHSGATREVVMYNKDDAHNVKGHFASYDTGKEHWKYYWLD